MRSITALVGFALLQVHAAPGHTARLVRHERRAEPGPSLWVKRSPVKPETTLPIRIGLTQSNLGTGHDMLMAVSDPTSTEYGKYFTSEEVHDMFAPSSETVDAVYAWLETAGISLHRVSQSENRQWLQFDAQTIEAEDLLKTTFHVYEHSSTGKTSIGCDEYHVHESVSHHIDYITPGVKLLRLHSPSERILSRRASPSKNGPIKSPFPHNSFVSESSLEYCDTYITPACIMAMYNVSRGTTSTKGNELGVFEETPANLDRDDMNLYFSHLASYIPNGTFPIIHEIDGAKNINKEDSAELEPLLDVQISYPLIYPQSEIFYQTDALDNLELEKAGIFNTFLDAIDGSYCTYKAFGEKGDNNTVDPIYPNPVYPHPLQCGVFKPTNVISLSYQVEEYLEGTTANYQKRQCNEYMKLGMQGISVVFASGDFGVASPEGCIGENGHAVFNPGFPSNCPYVTSVGGTTLTGHPTKDQEQATTKFGSGGGFSNYFARPSYQDAAVEAYFNSPSGPRIPYYTGADYGNGFYNRSGRGFPDVAAIGQDILNFAAGEAVLLSGTSAAAPVFAALLTRINEERLSANKSTVGFVNPLLYQNPQAFHDITVGNNIIAQCEDKGFEAGEGWDPVTGLGTPNYPALLEAFMNAP